MLIGEGGNADAEIAQRAHQRDQLARISQPCGMRLPRRQRAAGRIPAKRQNVTNTGARVIADDPAQLSDAVTDSGEVGNRGDGGLGGDAFGDADGAIPTGTAGSVGDGDEGGRVRLEVADGPPELPFALVGLRREEFEREGLLATVEQLANRLGPTFSCRTPPRVDHEPTVSAGRPASPVSCNGLPRPRAPARRRPRTTISRPRPAAWRDGDLRRRGA